MISRGLSLLLGLSVLLLGACGPANASQDDTQTETISHSSGVVETARKIRAITVAEGVLSTTRSASANVEPVQQAQVAAGTSGQIAEIISREGSVVIAGDAIIRLDDKNLRLQVQNASIAVESSKVNLQKAQNATQEGVASADAALEVAVSNFNAAERQYNEARILFDRGAISQVDLNNLETQLKTTQANLQQSQNALSQSQRANGEDIELLRLQLRQAQTQLSQAQSTLGDALITAPFAGEIAEIMVEQGEFIGAGSPAFKLVSAERQVARFSVPPQDAQGLIRQGQIYISYSGLDYAAQVIRSSDISGQSRLVEITAEVYPSDVSIPTGAVAQVNYNIDLADGIRLPSGAIKTSAGASYVYVVQDGIAVRQTVTTLAESGGQSVVSGLTPNTQVVYPIPSDLRDGLEIKVLAGLEQ